MVIEEYTKGKTSLFYFTRNRDEIPDKNDGMIKSLDKTVLDTISGYHHDVGDL